MPRRFFSIYIDAACLVYRSEMQNQMKSGLQLVGIYGQAGAIPQIFMGFKLPADAGEYTFR